MRARSQVLDRDVVSLIRTLINGSNALMLNRYSRTVDGSIPVPALLYDDERLLASQDGVGLYDGYVLMRIWC